MITVTKQYLKSLAGGGASSESGGSGVDISGFTMSGDIDMDGNEVVGLDIPSTDSSATNKKYVDDKVTNVGSISQAQADATYLKKTDATTTYETETSASNTYLSKTDATSTYALIGSSYTEVESDAKYATTMSGGLSSSGFTMTGHIDMIMRLKGCQHKQKNTSATNKSYVDNNFLSRHGGSLLENVTMSGQSITDLNPTPNNNDAVTKSYVDNSIALSGGLSVTGLTMQGDIDMNGNEIKGLADPINDDMAASKGFVESNFLDLAGGTMVGDIDMGGHKITNLLRTPTTDLSAVTKKWVTDEFPTKQEVLGGFTLTGSLNLSGNEIYGLPDVPTTDNSAMSKKYVDSKITTGSGASGASTSGFTMQADINMGGYEVISCSIF